MARCEGSHAPSTLCGPELGPKRPMTCEVVINHGLVGERPGRDRALWGVMSSCDVIVKVQMSLQLAIVVWMR